MPNTWSWKHPRERLLRSSIALVRAHGVEGTGLTELLERSGTARRSIYQHFPGGKDELIAASTRAAGSWMKRVGKDVGGQGAPLPRRHSTAGPMSSARRWSPKGAR
ncbi:TetR/AcrR family transcriptional regulator [Nocardioides limicola]|uniref:TetR/AcrR family transcriptional regulator n=1 Tax=Nocardioides limicola TaxID=2803368 RepID=UPI0035591C24